MTAFEQWLEQAKRVVVIELGAGSAIPTVRMFSERVARQENAIGLIRINPTESRVPYGQIGIAQGALEALRGIDEKRATSGRKSEFFTKFC